MSLLNALFVVFGVFAVLQAASVPTQNAFVRRSGRQFTLRDIPFRFAGANSYYIPFHPQGAVDNLFQVAADNHFNVIRTWAFCERQQDPYFLGFDGTKPVPNDGPNGLEHLDYVVAQAGKAGVKVILTLTNNWSDYGGMDEYVKWNNGQYHDEFYTNPTLKEWFKSYISALVNRNNTVNGKVYKNDDAIFAWELANEPRCGGSGGLPTSSSCKSSDITAWADEISSYVKSIDSNHLVSVGDEGFLCEEGSTDYLTDCDAGDNKAYSAVRNVDYMSVHLYPTSWGKDVSWGSYWVSHHIEVANDIDKPMVLGEFGITDKDTRDSIYQNWTSIVLNEGGGGDMVWLLAANLEDGTPYPDYDGLSVYCPSSTCELLSQHAQDMARA